MSNFVTPFSEQIWNMKYRFKDPNKNPIDESVSHSWRRVAKSLSSLEQDQKKWETTRVLIFLKICILTCTYLHFLTGYWKVNRAILFIGGYTIV